jgi:ABC-type branched-subunit amino acid transport system substrate-binding protein
MRASEFTGESLVSLEGYANARVLAEGMRRAGPKLDRDSVTAGLESMSDFDLGGLRIRYGKEAREGNTYTDIITVAQNGQIIS